MGIAKPATNTSKEVPNRLPHLNLYVPLDDDDGENITLTTLERTCTFKLFSEVAQKFGIQLGLTFNSPDYRSCAMSLKLIPFNSLIENYQRKLERLDKEKRDVHGGKTSKSLSESIAEHRLKRDAINACLLQLTKEFPAD